MKILRDTTARLRRDLITNRWTINNPARNKRPRQFAESNSNQQQQTQEILAASTATAAKPTRLASCAFCPGNESQTPTEILRWDEDMRDLDGSDSSWALRVVPNAFPAVTPLSAADGDGEHGNAREKHDERAIAEMARAARRTVANAHDQLEIPALGRHLVVIESPEHDLLSGSAAAVKNSGATLLHRFTHAHVRRLLRAWHRVGGDIAKADALIRSNLYFKNTGANAGASLEHPHAQLVSLPIIPQETDRNVSLHLSYFEEHHACNVFDVVLDSARKRELIVCENDDFAAMVPFAALSPFHVRVFSKTSTMAHFEHETPERVDAAASVVSCVLQKIDQHLAFPDFNVTLSTPPLPGRFEAAALDFTTFTRWHLDVSPRLGAGALAGFELGSGLHSNSTAPEESARVLRGVVV